MFFMDKTLLSGMNLRNFCSWLVPLALVALGGCASLELAPSPRQPSNREAILILPGLDWKFAKARSIMKGSDSDDIKSFATTADSAGFDVFLADYKRRKSVDAGVEALRQFVEQHNIASYDRVHVFAYILGGYTFNRYLTHYPMENLASAVYDRSPLQELAPGLATEGWFSVLTWIAMGPVVADLAATPYTPIPRSDDYRIGLIIENRATRFIRKRRKRALAVRPLTFEPDSLGQPFHAAIHVRFNHVEMYSNFDVIGPELIHFFAHGDFSPEALRQPLGIDPFTKN